MSEFLRKALRSHHNGPRTTEDKYVHICMIDVCVSAKNHHRVSLSGHFGKAGRQKICARGRTLKSAPAAAGCNIKQCAVLALRSPVRDSILSAKDILNLALNYVSLKYRARIKSGP